MSRPFDLNLLPVLVKIYENGSVSAAAAQLGVSQSAISGALGKLRQLYGDPLFHRVGHGMRPTARMHALIDPLRESLLRVEGTISAEEEFDPATTSLTFAFAMSDLGEMRSLPKMLQHIRHLAPRAAVRSVVASADHIKRGLESGEIDLAVGYFPDLRDKAFTEQHLFFHQFACLLRADHPITAAALSMTQFLSVEHAIVSGAGRTFELIERYFRSKKIQRRVALETPHFMTIPFVISQSDLIATVPHALGVFARSAHMNIRIAEPPMRTPHLDLKMHWHRKFQRDPKNRWLREAVASVFTDEPDISHL